MTSEEEIIIAFLFKRSGKNELKESEIYLPLSLELGWFSSQQAISFLKHALNQKLLVKKGEMISPNFDIEKTKIPVGFYPSKKSFDAKQEVPTTEEKKSILDKIIYSIVKQTHQNEKDIISKIKDVEKEKDVLPELAALVVAKENNVDVKDYFDLIKTKIFIENEE